MQTKPIRVLLTDAKPYDREFFDQANQHHRFDIHYLDSRLSAETVELTQGFHAVCAFVNDQLDKTVADRLVQHGIRLVALRCAGYNNVDLKAAYGTLHVARVPSYSPHAVAEHAVALILSLNRKIHKAYYRTRDNNFSIHGLLGFDLHGKTAGVIGTGKIGRILAGILRGFGMEVLAYDPHPDEQAAREVGFRYAPLDEVYRRSHVLSLHCPLTPETQHMINAKSIALMRKDVILINTGRGKLIRTSDLIAGLKSSRIGAAGLDVYEEEEDYFFEDFSGRMVDDDQLARLLTFSNVLVTSHQAFFTREALTAIAETTLGNVDRFLAGEPLPNEICYRCGEETCRKETKGRCF